MGTYHINKQINPWRLQTVVTRGFATQRANGEGFNVLFDASLNTLFNKHSVCQLFGKSWRTYDFINFLSNNQL